MGKGGDDSSECICVIIDSRMLRTGAAQYAEHPDVIHCIRNLSQASSSLGQDATLVASANALATSGVKGSLKHVEVEGG